MMVHNFSQRGVPLKGIEFFTNFEEIKQKYVELGYDENFEIFDMNTASMVCLDQNEYQR